MKRLKPEYEHLNYQFNRDFKDTGCSCFLNPPCGYCTHEGNPLNLEETEDAWEFVSFTCFGIRSVLKGQSKRAKRRALLHKGSEQ